MNELQRQRYLSALGIDTFVPRLVLPCAPPSVPCELPEATVPAAAGPAVMEAVRQPASTATATASGASGADTVGQVLRDMGVAKPTAVRKEPLKAAVPKQREVLETIHLHLWRPADDLIVVDHYHPGDALPNHTLLSNMLRLLWPNDVRIDAGEAIRCPISDKVASLYTREDMQVELQAWLSEELQKTPKAQVWLLGGEAAKYLVRPSTVNTKQPSDDKSRAASRELTGVEPEQLHFKRLPLAVEPSAAADALVLPSLTDMLNAPELKNKLWRAVHSNG